MRRSLECEEGMETRESWGRHPAEGDPRSPQGGVVGTTGSERINWCDPTPDRQAVCPVFALPAWSCVSGWIWGFTDWGPAQAGSPYAAQAGLELEAQANLPTQPPESWDCSQVRPGGFSSFSLGFMSARLYLALEREEQVGGRRMRAGFQVHFPGEETGSEKQGRLLERQFVLLQSPLWGRTSPPLALGRLKRGGVVT